VPKGVAVRIRARALKAFLQTTVVASILHSSWGPVGPLFSVGCAERCAKSASSAAPGPAKGFDQSNSCKILGGVHLIGFRLTASSKLQHLSWLQKIRNSEEQSLFANPAFTCKPNQRIRNCVRELAAPRVQAKLSQTWD
jgi:hypothetical protein